VARNRRARSAHDARKFLCPPRAPRGCRGRVQSGAATEPAIRGGDDQPRRSLSADRPRRRRGGRAARGDRGIPPHAGLHQALGLTLRG
jgi:hypothetical protein